jgi:hypothetical protein
LPNLSLVDPPEYASYLNIDVLQQDKILGPILETVSKVIDEKVTKEKFSIPKIQWIRIDESLYSFSGTPHGDSVSFLM